jgi:RNA polymerase sigma-70 factor (ECF subfamily)
MNAFETDLIEQAKNDDSEAFNRLFSQEQKYVFNLMYQLTGDPASADDLTQEALILAYRKLASFRFQASFRTWLSKIAINLSRATYRCKSKHISLCLEEIKAPSTEDHPERIIIKRELQWCILHNLQYHLPEKYRIVLVLRDLQNLSYKEISEILGWNMS